MLSKLVSPTWAVLEYGWYPLLVFIATPYFLHTLGPNKYGHWMLLTATVSFGAILNVGTGAATIKLVSARHGQAASEEIEGLIRSLLAIALIGGAFAAVLIIVMFWLAGDAFFGKMGDQLLLRLTGGVAALLAWIEQIDNVFASALKGGEEFGRAARIEMASKTIQVFAAVLVVTMWGSMAALYATLVLVAIVRTIAKSRATVRFLAIKSLCPSFANMADILHYAKWGWLQGVGGLLFGIVDRLLVGSFLGAASLSHYSVASQLAQQIHALSAASLSVLFPKVSRKLTKNTSFSLRRITALTMGGNLFATSVLTLGLMIFGRNILTLWLGDAEAEATAETLWYLTIAYWLLAINVVPHFILMGIGRIRFLAMSNLVAGIVLLIAMFILIQYYQLVGIAVARIVYGTITLVNCLSLLEYLWSKRGKLGAKIEGGPLAAGA